MLESTLAMLHNATTLLFGVYISAALLGVRMKRRNVLTLLGFTFAVGRERYREDLSVDDSSAAGAVFDHTL